jgi:hypothetical protein
VSHADWSVQIEDAHNAFDRNHDAEGFRREMARLGFYPDEIDRYLSHALQNQRPADGLLHSNFDRQQGVMG